MLTDSSVEYDPAWLVALPVRWQRLIFPLLQQLQQPRLVGLKDGDPARAFVRIARISLSAVRLLPLLAGIYGPAGSGVLICSAG